MHEETLTQNEVSLRDYFDLLRRRRTIIIQMFAAALVIGIVLALVSRPVYRSEGRLLVTPPSPTMNVRDTNDPLNALFATSMVHNVETQIQVLTTPSLLEQAYRASGQTPADPRIMVSVNNEKDIDIIDLATEAYNPQAAEDVTNNLMSLYIDQDKKNRNGDLDKAIAYVEKGYQDAYLNWEKAAKAVQDFQNKTLISDFSDQERISNQQLQALEEKEEEVSSSIDGLDAEMDVMLRQPVQQQVSKVTYAPNPAIPTIKAKLDELNADMQAKLQLFKPDHPTIKSLNAQIQAVQENLAKAPLFIPSKETTTNPEIQNTQVDVHKLVAQKAQLVAQAASVHARKLAQLAKLKTLGTYQFKQASLIQKRDLAQDDAKSLASQLNNLRLRQNAQSSPITVLSAAGLNPNPVRPKRPLIILMSALAGLFLGVCFALLQEFLDDRVNAPEDARRLLGVPALGYIPHIERDDQRLLTAESSGGSVLESYRVLRSNVRFAAVGEPLNSIMVTSTAPGEGKSVTAANLAVAIALDGKRVILVDADLRRPTLHEKFGVRNTPGLTNVLVGAMNLDKALQDTPVENLQVLTSGPIPPNPAELLNSRAMEQVQEMLKERADVVVFDSPPCLSVADAQVLAATVDGLIYVVQLGSTKKSALRHGNELLHQAHARILGIVYNKLQVDSGRSDYYYGYYSYYHKAELPSKSNGNGKSHRNKTSSAWEELTAQAKAQEATAITAAEPDPARKSKASQDKSSRSDTADAEKADTE